MNVKVAGFLDNSLVNGKGIRSVLFVSGCKHNCINCHNRAMQDFNYGEDLDTNEILQRIKDNIPIIKGVTFSGGEPFEQSKALSILAKQISELDLDIWCYTGYTFEEILKSHDKNKMELLENIQVLVDGKFNKEFSKNPPKYVGSSNQRIINVKSSLDQGKVIQL